MCEAVRGEGGRREGGRGVEVTILTLWEKLRVCEEKGSENKKEKSGGEADMKGRREEGREGRSVHYNLHARK